MKQLMKEFPNDVRVIFKHNPLGFHKRALPAAKASMAAHAQGKFWEYHDLLFSKTKKFDDATLEKYAADLGLNLEKFRADMESPAVLAKIKHDQASMVGHGAGGTPAFFVNGKYVKGAKPFAAFKTEAEQAIREADAAIANGTSLADVHRVLAGKNAGKTFVDSVVDGKAPPARGKGAPKKSANRPKQNAGPVSIEIHPDDAMKGNPKAAVTIVEFSEFQ